MKPITKKLKGEALTVVMIVLVMMAAISATVMSLGYNQRRIQQTAGGGKTVAYYLAKGGIVDAFWRLQHKIDKDGNPNYTWPTNATVEYDIDVAGHGAMDTHVKITAPDAITGLRTITASDK